MLQAFWSRSFTRLLTDNPDVEICPLYAGLPSALQMKALRPVQDDIRKMILATNIAETSITIPGVKYVIDTGFVKAKGSIDPRFTSLFILLATILFQWKVPIR